MITHDGRSYSTVMGSDVQRDGMYLECNDVTDEEVLVMEAFWRDADSNFTVRFFRETLPFSVVEAFLEEAARRLPPKRDAR